MIAVIFDGAGGPEVMRLEERDDPVPGGREVLVEVTYAGLNPADLGQRRGAYAPPRGSPRDVPGIEVAGRVIDHDPNVRRWQIGDRVFGLVGGGGLADRVVVPEELLAPIPGTLDDAAAAAIPEAFVTAHDAVFVQGELRPGESLLVNGANGGVGTAAIQLARAINAHVIAATRSPATAERLERLGACETVDLDRDERPRDVDVVLELIGGGNIPRDIERLMTQGRVVVVGTSGGTDATLHLRTLMTKRGRIIGTTLRSRTLPEKAAAVAAFERSVVPLLETGAVAAVIDRVFAASDFVAAFAHLESRGKLGKVMLEFDGSH
jgi:NADPH:quinone reductase-like Zn-dependent oxidoreductase